MLATNVILGGVYQIIAPIGKGGGGEVYKAWHLRLEKEVVVKRILERVRGVLDNRAEADILKNLRHTHLPQVYDFLVEEDGVYTVMDYIPGGDFSKLLKQPHRFAQKDIIKWAKQLCSALDYLHTQAPPIIHSDVKPANVMLTPTGDICLIDFNISMYLTDGEDIPLGLSDGYASPEQYSCVMRRISAVSGAASPPSPAVEETGLPGAQTTVVTDTYTTTVLLEEPKSPEAGFLPAGSRYLIDQRSDLYSLGAFLYHLAFGGKLEGALTGTGNPAPSKDIGNGLWHIIEKATQLQPNKRYQSARDMLQALERVYKLDNRYRMMAVKQDILFLMLLAVASCFVLMTVFGYRLIGVEKEENYFSLIDQAQAVDPEQGLALLEEASLLFPDKIDAYYQKALLIHESQGNEALCTYCEELLQASAFQVQTQADQKTMGELYYLQANALFEQEEYKQAIPIYEQAIANLRDNAALFRDYAIACARDGDFDKARSSLEQAIRLGLGQDSIYLVNGEMDYLLEEYHSCIEYLAQTLSLSDDDYIKQRAYITSANAYKQAVDTVPDATDKRIALLQIAVREMPGERQLVLTEMLADAYLSRAREDPDAAQNSLAQALELFQELESKGYSSFTVYQNIATLHMELGQYDEAVALLDELRALYPDNYQVYVRLAFCCADMQTNLSMLDRNYDKVLEYYELALPLYEEQSKQGKTDPEMQMLEALIDELRQGNWLK